MPRPSGAPLSRLDHLDLPFFDDAHRALARDLDDFAFAMQGLGSGPITLTGSTALQQAILPRVARLRLGACRVPKGRLLGVPGEGFKLAMRTLDIFRASVAAVALGFARRALDEALRHAARREMFGQRLADFQLTQATLGDMAADIDAAALLTYRAARRGDLRALRTTREAAMAKTVATEDAQRVIDRALQMHGGLGVRAGSVVESLYREIRALRIYEGATEVQRLIIGRDLLAAP